MALRMVEVGNEKKRIKSNVTGEDGHVPHIEGVASRENHNLSHMKFAITESETAMDNETGLAILSALLDSMSYPNKILTSEEANSTGIDVKDLHKILLTGCYYPPKLQNITDITTNDKEVDKTTDTTAVGNETNLVPSKQ
ncbi:hypothetical protein DAPPUDRAFT_100898 [Daphnia pulex]|uniref:Uncharacterized protein n=1 Tax=Daphnia pulex TaxID=6669 RepID=E9GBL3_DAPPU|nr:hypothetical protein DAPPUDRAFT_100898 [Daphnia pulex]|eukprot:EFX82976.1 hypothetical protein DAPPUDRAFT_100898 [Daphnia pulex]